MGWLTVRCSRLYLRPCVLFTGEANAGRAANYACQMRAMIEGWRSAWQQSASSTEAAGTTSAEASSSFDLGNFTFIEHQLSACTYGGDVPALRWSQQGAVAPWTDIPATAMTVGLDLYDATSPCANVHIRNKTAVGERMARAALAVTYNHNVSYTGPVATSFAVGGGGIKIGFSGATSPLKFLSIPSQTVDGHAQGFEVQLASNGSWVQVSPPARPPDNPPTRPSVLPSVLSFCFSTHAA